MKTIIIIPTYNEKKNISQLIPAIFALNIHGLEIIVVDDNSPDGTAELISELCLKYPVKLIKRRAKLGLGSAYIAGFKKALFLEAEFIGEMDADFSHDPKDLPRLLEAIQTADMVIGSRKIKHGKIIGWNWRRKLMSNGAMWFSRLLLGLKTKDVTAGFRLFRRKVLMTIPLDQISSNGYAFQEEMLYRAEKSGFKIKEIPVSFADRREGQSKLSKEDIIEFFIIIIKLKFARKRTQSN
ncbi:MAG: polyprenol monophosphomannose synthase [bacterium]